MGDTSTTSPPLAPSASEQETSNMLIPEGFRLHTENSASILLPDTADAFLNPVQEFNRDLSVACIRVWGDDMNAKRKEKWENKAQNRGKGKGKRAAGPDALDDVGLAKKLKGQSGEAVEVEAKSSSASQHHDEMIVEEQIQVAEEVKPDTIALEDFRPQKFVILEALSATGLRSIRYAKEIPLVKYVIANDLDPAATAAIRRNVGLNGLGPQPQTTESETGDDIATTDQALSTRKPPPADLGKVQINEGDACDLMYSHRPEHHRVDVVDLDPYGTAAPFIDAAVQCVKEDGLICVTCTDLSVLASGNFPEKCFSNYGGVSMKAEYCHEAALRLVLHTISTSAARYGRYITPLLSLSIDFYVRLFVRIRTAPIEVKKAMVNTSLYHICTGCQSFYPEPLGRVLEKKGANGNTNLLFKSTHSSTNTDTCEECGGKLHVAGPMWSGLLYDQDFVTKLLTHINDNSDRYGTHARMKGMVTVASEEITAPFYFTPARVASHFHCESPSLNHVVSALLNAGCEVSRSHACPGSIKTNAPRSLLHDIMRTWILDHPVRLDKVKEETCKTLLAKPLEHKADFTKHPGVESFSTKIKLVRYPLNPQPNWGPAARPDSSKRKRDKP